MGHQLRQLKTGAHVVVGTPGRVMDHMRRGTLDLTNLTCLVLDEADEMLRMGFVEDVEWILEQTSAGRQIALFSATMPPAIRSIANRYLNKPQQIAVKAHTAAAETIRQRVCRVPTAHKVEALVRILDAEPIEKALIFVRTRANTIELADKLRALGHRCAPLNGDIPQRQREHTVEQLKTGRLSILIATDVAARGLHVDGISHVINYDAAGDVETYVHRIGRTGRAGQTGEAILFVGPRDRRIVSMIERATRAKITEMAVPRAREINIRRVARFKERIQQRIALGELDVFENILGQLHQECDASPLQVAAALASLLQGDEPILVKDLPMLAPETSVRKSHGKDYDGGRRPAAGTNPYSRSTHSHGRDRGAQEGKSFYRLEMGSDDGLKHANIVGAIANEIGLEGKQIGRITIEAQYSTVDLPSNMPESMVQRLQDVRIFGKPCRIRNLPDDTSRARPTRAPKKDRPLGKRKPRKMTPKIKSVATPSA
ncbi:MAG: helicase-related protein, partial [Myxococcota bacterium]